MIVQQATAFKRTWLVPAAVLLLSSGVRLLNLGHDSLWLDEVNTLNAVRAATTLVELSERDHPPMLYWLTAAAVGTLGTSEMALRLVSALAGSVATALLWRLGRALGGRTSAAWAALALALLPFHLRYSQEARHYSLLFLFSLLSSLCLLAAMRRPGARRWAAFGVATALNLYTHYGAFLLLAAQGVVVLGWLAARARRRDWAAAALPAAAGAVGLALYAPWLPRAWQAIRGNTGPDAVMGTTTAAPLGQWAGAVVTEFGFGRIIPAVIVLLLAGWGMGVWLRTRRRDVAALALAVFTVPLLLIVGLDVARWSLPKYVIYQLPLYLLAFAAGLDDVLNRLSARWPAAEPARRRVAAAALLLLLLPGALGVRAEWRRMERDWRSAVQALRAQADDGVVVFSLAMDLPDGFDQGGIVLPYYLDRAFTTYTLLGSNSLRADQLRPLLSRTAPVWGVALNRISPVTSPRLITTDFGAGLATLALRDPAGTTVDQLLALTTAAAPAAVAPAPQCLLWEDVALMHHVADAPEAAADALAQAQALCPAGSGGRNALAGDVYAAVLERATARGDAVAAQQAAAALLVLDAKQPAALATLTVVDLAARLAAGDGVVSAESAPEPVTVRRFTMPRDGDFEDVIFMHPPAHWRLPVTLPETPTVLRARLALDPASWEWGGDGVTFVVTVAADAGTTTLLRRHVTQENADRRWHDVTLPLDAWAGQTVTLTLATESGPNGDDSADWAGWGAPRILLVAPPSP